ncbi:MAG: lipid-A-disaccharide synthase [Deltaproteobacteria bacterium]
MMNDLSQNSKPGTKNFLIVAGEASGDLHGANLVRELLALEPNIRFSGMGGDMMKDAGVDVLHHVREMAIVGIFEVINKLPLIRKAMKDMENLMDIIKPEVVVLIDYPGFNLRLAKKAKARGIKVVYYVSPQVWAWHKSRVKTIARVVDKMMVVFPFEVRIYEKVGVDVEFVGHPLMDSVPAGFDRDEIRGSLGFGRADTVIGLLPGSRKREVESLLPEMLEAARLISKKINGAKFAIPVANTLDVEYIKGFTDGVDLDLSVFKGNTYDVMAAADLILIASGTATLEAAIVGTPMVMTYRMAPLTYFIGRRLVNLEFGSLPNIIAGKGIIPELVQGDATGERMAEECLNILEDKKRSEEMKKDLRKVRDTLGGPGASKRAAEIVYKTLQIAN